MTPTRVFVVAPTPTIRAGLRSMLAAVETTDLLVVGEAGMSAGPVPPLSGADVVLVADEELLEEAALSVSEDGTQSLLLLSEPPAAVEELSEPLTAREGEVLGLLGRGLSNKMIARELHISEHTVKFHISSIFSKLGVSNRAEAVSQGARYGLISL